MVSLHGDSRSGIYHSRGDGPSAHARRVPLTELRDSSLRQAMTAWDGYCGLDNAFDRSKHPVAEIYTDSRLLTPRSSVLRVTDHNPQKWIFVYFGAGFGVFGGQSYVGRRMCDFPAKATTEVSAYSFADAAVSKRPVAHEIEGVMENFFIKYQRIAFPILDCDGELFEMLTISSDVFRVTFD